MCERAEPTLDVGAVRVLDPDGWIQHPVDDLHKDTHTYKIL